MWLSKRDWCERKQHRTLKNMVRKRDKERGNLPFVLFIYPYARDNPYDQKVVSLNKKKRWELTEWNGFPIVSAEKLKYRYVCVNNLQNGKSYIPSDERLNSLVIQRHDKTFWKTIKNKFAVSGKRCLRHLKKDRSNIKKERKNKKQQLLKMQNMNFTLF